MRSEREFSDMVVQPNVDTLIFRPVEMDDLDRAVEAGAKRILDAAKKEREAERKKMTDPA